MLKTVSGSRGPSLSKAWEVSKAHKGAYSGGKVEISNDGTFVACLYDADVSFLDVEEGAVKKRLTNEGGPGAEEEILTFALHPSGREIVTACRTQLLRHWDIETGDCKRAIRAHGHIVLCMEYDGTGTLVATGGSDHTAKVWDIERGYCTHNFRGHTGVVSVVAHHPDPKRLVLVSGSEDTTVRVWDLSRQCCTAVLKAHLSYVTSMAFLPRGAGLVTGGRDRVLNVWNLELNRSDPLKTFPVYEEVEGLQVLPRSKEFSGKYPTSRGDLLAVAGKKGVVRLFALEGQKSLANDRVVILLAVVLSLSAVQMEADEPSPASAAIANSVKKKPKKKKDETTKKSNGKNADPASPSTPARTTMAMALPKKLSCRCVMTQDTHAASHRAGYTALVLDRRRGGLIAVTADHNLLLLEPSNSPGSGGGGGVSLSTKRQIVGYNDEVIDIKSLPIRTQELRGGVNQKGEAGEDGESWIAVATNSPQVRLFELGGFSCRLLDGHTDTVLALDVAPDGRHLCTSSKDRTCLLWDIDLGAPVVRWSGHSDAVGAVAASRKPGPWFPPSAASPSGSSGAFVVSGAADRTLQRWDVPSLALVATTSEEGTKRSRSKARSAATSMGVGGYDNSRDGDAGLGVEGKTEGEITPLVETATRSVRAHEKDINCVAISPNDAMVASASQDRTVKLWRSRDLEPMGVLRGHRRGVWKVEFSPVDRCVATCSGDRTAKVWSIADCSCLRTFQGHTASVLSVTFISAGAQLLSGGADGLVKLWTLRSDECEATLDGHTDKIWALTTAVAPKRRQSVVSPEEEEGDLEGDEGSRGGANAGVVVVSGGADSVINVWKDVTVREEEKAIAEKEAALLKEQELSNRLRDKDYGPAIALALELKRPHRLWSVLRDAMTHGMGEETVDAACGGDATTEMSSRKLDEFVSSWNMETVSQCLGYCRDWNTNAKKAIVVHALLGSILRCVGIASLKEMPDCAELVRSLLPYSERHFQRLDRLLQSSYLVEYTLASMQMLLSSDPNGATAACSDQGKTLDADPRVRRRPLEQESKRPREERMVVDGGEDPGDDGGSGSDSEGNTKSSTVPVSEVVDGRLVFNVRLEAAVDGGSSNEDEGEDTVTGMAHDAGDSKLHGRNTGFAAGWEERDDDADQIVARKPKKKRRKRDAGESDGVRSVAAPLGLLRQPDAKQGKDGGSRSSVREGNTAVALVDGINGVNGRQGNGEAVTLKNGERKRKKKRSKTESLAKAAVDEDAEDATVRGQQQQEEDILVEVTVAERQKQADGVREEDWHAKAEKQNGERTGKKKKKRSGKGRRRDSRGEGD